MCVYYSEMFFLLKTRESTVSGDDHVLSPCDDHGGTEQRDLQFSSLMSLNI